MVSGACFGVRVSVMFHLMFVKQLSNRLAICFHCFVFYICNIYLFPVLVLDTGFGV